MNRHPFLKSITSCFLIFFLIFFLGFIMKQNNPAEWLEFIGLFGMFFLVSIGLAELVERNRK